MITYISQKWYNLTDVHLGCNSYCCDNHRNSYFNFTGGQHLWGLQLQQVTVVTSLAQYTQLTETIETQSPDLDDSFKYIHWAVKKLHVGRYYSGTIFFPTKTFLIVVLVRTKSKIMVFYLPSKCYLLKTVTF